MAKKNFNDLTEKEILALAIQLEEEDGRVYGDFAEGLRESIRQRRNCSRRCRRRKTGTARA